uniref:Uncharacterized protein n=1 Tax=Pithovirus LCDPAC02 TaxID=2506601 RepID=A0A481YPL4_9VIRU|nr:MAG: hypothetical protein LCDPAC02_03710 [Pithovirus LCDPAC02]
MDVIKPYHKDITIDKESIDYGDWDDPIMAKGYMDVFMFEL